MCSACENLPIEPRVAVDMETVHRAREIEAAMPGDRLPDDAWAVFFGFAGGAIEYPHYQRIYQAYEKAENGRIKLRRGLRRVTAPVMSPAALAD